MAAQKGFNTLHDITDRQGQLLDWDNRKQLDLLPRHRRAYTDLCASIDIDSVRLREMETQCQIFVAELPIKDEARVWQFLIKKRDRRRNYRFGDQLREPKRMFRLRGGILYREEILIPHQGMPLRRVSAGLPSLDTKGAQKLLLIARQGDAIEVTEHFQWRNGKDVFDITTGQLRMRLPKEAERASKCAQLVGSAPIRTGNQ